MNLLKKYLKSKKEQKTKENNAWRKVNRIEINTITHNIKYFWKNKKKD